MESTSESLEERLERVIYSPPEPMHGPVPSKQYACDMHVHSSHSHEIPDLDCYSPLAKMVLAFERGMHYFTLTDHHTYTGILELQEQLSRMGRLGKEAMKRFIPGVEVNVYVERVKQVIHTNIYGLTEEQWQDIQQLHDPDDEVKDFTALTEYLKANNLPYSFNHPFWKPMVKNQLPDLLKRIIPGVPSEQDDPISLVSLGLIFPEFPLIEVNGSRIEPLNDLAEYFALVHGIPLIAGSDDHYTIPLGNCYTLAKGNTTKKFLNEILRGNSKVMRGCLDEELAGEQAEHVVDIYMGGLCDPRIYLGNLLNMELKGLSSLLLSLWRPKYLPYVKKRFVKMGTSGYLQSQYSCLPNAWRMALVLGKKTPVREALDRLKEKR